MVQQVIPVNFDQIDRDLTEIMKKLDYVPTIIHAYYLYDTRSKGRSECASTANGRMFNSTARENRLKRAPETCTLNIRWSFNSLLHGGSKMAAETTIFYEISLF